MWRRCSPRTTPATASTTSAAASCRRRCSSATSPRRRRSAVQPSAARYRRRKPRRHPARRTSPRRITSKGCRWARAGGAVVRYTFPLSGTYEIQMRLARDRNENVEGLIDPQQVELTLDGRPVQMFTVRPNRNQMGIYYADEAVDKDLRVRLRVTAGVARRRRHVPAANLRARRGRTAAVAGALQHGPAPADADGALLGVDRRAGRARRRGRHAEPPPAVPAAAPRMPPARSRPPAEPRRGREAPTHRRARGASCRRWRGARSGGPSPPPTSTRRCVSTARRARADGLRGRHRDGRSRRARQHRVPVPHRAGPAGAPPGSPPIASATSSWRRACRSSSGAACRTTSCWTWRSPDDCDGPKCWSGRSDGCWPTPRPKRS